MSTNYPAASSLPDEAMRPVSVFDFRSKPSTPSSPLQPGIAAIGSWSPEQLAAASTAALTIQRHFRGFLGRRRYAARMWEVYAEEEEKQRKEKEKVLVEETEILVAARKAVIDMEELETVSR